MASLLQALENNEAILLMYLAQELTAEDRAEVEQMLASDVGLRADLNRLAGAHSSAIEILRDLDRRDPVRVSTQVAVRNVVRSMNQWQVDRLARPSTAPAVGQLRFPWWFYPTVSAAAIIISATVWWGMQSDVPQPVPGPEVQQELARDTGPMSANPTPPQTELAGIQPFAGSNESSGITEAEQEATSLAMRSNVDLVASSIFLTDSSADPLAEESNTP